MHGECDANKGPQSDSLPNRMYILPHVQEFLAGLDSTREDGLTRWTLGVRNAVESGDALPPSPTAEWNLGAQTELEAGDELPPFPTTAGVTPEGMDKAVKSGPQTRAQVEQGGAVGSVAGSRHVEGDRDDALAGQVEIPQARPSTSSAIFTAATFPRTAGSVSPSYGGGQGGKGANDGAPCPGDALPLLPVAETTPPGREAPASEGDP